MEEAEQISKGRMFRQGNRSDKGLSRNMHGVFEEQDEEARE